MSEQDTNQGAVNQSGAPEPPQEDASQVVSGEGTPSPSAATQPETSQETAASQTEAMPNAGQAAQYAAPTGQPAPPNSAQEAPKQQDDDSTLTMGHWMLVLLLMAIPIVNIVMLFIWGFGAKAAPAKKNWARAQLIWMAIWIAVSLIFSGVIIAGITSAVLNSQGIDSEDYNPPAMSQEYNEDSADTVTAEESDEDESSVVGSTELDQNFAKIELGMAPSEVRSIMGSKGKTVSESKSKHYSSLSLRWSKDSDMVSCLFSNGKLISRSLSSSDRTSEGKATQAGYESLDEGMSYSAVKSALGGSGKLVSESHIGDSKNQTYEWFGDNYATIICSFTKGKLTSMSQSGMDE
ncbi:MAG: DUF3862 domain-containing protein [Coriobacteriales bacterium]|jgi:hypothetical protein